MNVFVRIHRKQTAMRLERIANLDPRHVAVAPERTLDPAAGRDRDVEIVDALEPAFDFLAGRQRHDCLHIAAAWCVVPSDAGGTWPPCPATASRSGSSSHPQILQKHRIRHPRADAGKIAGRGMTRAALG